VTLVFLLEELSMKAFLDGLLPRLLPDGVDYKLIPHAGKADLERSIPRKLRAWRAPDARFVVVRDQDGGDCVAIKGRLLDLCRGAGRSGTLVRIACQELEAWYLADLAAVDVAYGTTLQRRQQRQKFREPDRLGSPSRELNTLVPAFGKVRGGRLLGPLLDIENTRSTSFKNFVRGLRALLETRHDHV
jgi:hypothetical protein